MTRCVVGVRVDLAVSQKLTSRKKNELAKGLRSLPWEDISLLVVLTPEDPAVAPPGPPMTQSGSRCGLDAFSFRFTGGGDVSPTQASANFVIEVYPLIRMEVRYEETNN